MYRLVNPFRNVDTTSNRDSWLTVGGDGGFLQLATCGDHGHCPAGEHRFNSAVLLFGQAPSFGSPKDAGRDNTYKTEILIRRGGAVQDFGRLAVEVRVHNLGGVPIIKDNQGRSGESIYTVQDDHGINWSWTITNPAGGTLSLVIGGQDGDLFYLNNEFGSSYTFGFKDVAPDFENPQDAGGDNTYNLVVKAHNGRATAVHPVTIRVNNAPDAPQLHGPRSLKWEVGGTGTVATYVASDADDSPITFSLAGTNSSLFNIGATSGVLTYNNAPTAATTHTVKVRATAGGQTVSQDLEVTVVAANSNQAPGAISGPAAPNFPESRTWVRVGNGTYGSTDTDGDTIFWSLTGADAALFFMGHDGALIFRSIPDFETKRDANTDNVYKVTVNATDGIDTVTKDVSVTVTDFNEPPAISGSETVSRDEGSDLTVATYTASDPEGVTAFTWSVLGKDADDFNIGSSTGALTFASAPSCATPTDAEMDNAYHVVVKVSDGTKFDTFPVEVTINCTPPNAAPTITGGPTSMAYTENSTHDIGTYTASDTDGDRLTWGVSGVDAALFTIDAGGRLSFRAVPDFENKRDNGADNIYNVTVTASDGTATGERAVVVTVRNLPEAPVVSGTADVVKAANSDTAVATYSATDPGGGGLTFGLSGPDASKFDITTAGVVTFKAVPDDDRADANGDNIYEVNVTARDAGNVTGSLAVRVVITYVNLQPTLADGGAAVGYAENGTGAVHAYTATDPENNTLHWSLSGADAADFRINGGTLRFRDSPDFEDPDDAGANNVYNVTVQVTDVANTAVSRAVTVTVTNVDEAPSLTGSSSLAVDENFSGTVATYTATDPEGDTITLALSGDDDADFSIDSDGDLTFGTSPNFESPHDANTDNVYKVTITATSGPEANRQSDSEDVTITVNDVNEAPVVSGSASLSVAENTAETVSLATYTATDPDDTSFTWSVAGDDGSSFRISSSGVLTFSNAPDFEDPRDGDEGNANRNNVYEIKVRARDFGGVVGELAVTVTVTNVDEAPVIAPTDDEGETAALTCAATDPEGDTLAWTLSGTDAADFTISASGALTFAVTPDFENPADSGENNVYDVTLTVTANGKTASRNVQVTVNNVDEVHTVSGPAGPSFAENGTGVVATYTGSDPEDATVRWDLAGTDGSLFSISRQGDLTFSEPPDHEAPGDDGENNVYEVIVRGVTDLHDVDYPVTVTVTNVNEAPSVSGPQNRTRSQGTARTVATYTAADPDAGSTFTWSLEGTDADDFEISSAGVLSLDHNPNPASPQDANGDNRYELTVKVTDNGSPGLSGTLDVQVKVAASNAAPTITSGPETRNQGENADTVSFYRASDGDADTIEWSVTDTDASLFTINRAGLLRFSPAPNFESPTDNGADNVYNVTVNASDGFSTATRAVVITVQNRNEGGRITVSATTPVVGTAVTATLTDPDGTTSGVTWKWETGFQPPLQPFAWTVISGATTNSYTPVAADDDKRLRVTATYTDDQFSVGGQTAQYNWGDTKIEDRSNNPPVFSPATATRSVAENTASGAVLGNTFTASDEDNDTLTYSLGGTDAASFSLNTASGELSTSAALDFETTTSYSVTITARDPAGGTGSIDVTITVTDVEEDGVVSFSPTTAAVGTEITASLTDDDGGVSSPTWAWSADGTAISGATSASYTPVNADIGKRLSAAVTYTDRRGSGKTASAQMAANVPGVTNEPPVLSCSPSSADYAEGGTTTVATYSANDPENQTIAWSLRGTDSGDFSIGSSSGALTFAATPDYEMPADSDTNNVYTLTVVASDGTNEDTCDVTITVTNEDETGSLTLRPSNPSVESAVTATLTDPDGNVRSQSWQWTRIVSGGSNVNVGTNSNTYTPVAADQGSQLQVTVSYLDAQSATERRTLTQTSSAVGAKQNRQPAFSVATAARTIAEDAANNTALGAAITATDPDGDTLTYSLSNGGSPPFTVGTNGQIRTSGTLDFETTTSYTLTLTAADPGGLSDSVTVTVTVTNVNEAPAISGDAERTYAEDTTGPVATWTAADPEGGTVTWSLSGTDAADFTINAGELSFAEQPDFEAPADANRRNDYSVTLNASDGSESSTLAVTVSVTNVDETGEITFSNPTPQVTVPFIATLTDPDLGVRDIEWQWKIGGNDIEDATRDRYTPRVDDVDLALSVGVTYTDRHGEGKTLEASVTNTVTAAPPVPFAPEFPPEEDGVREISEDAAIGTSVGGPVGATDANEDDNENLIYTLDSSSQAFFDINSTTGQLTTKVALDYEARRSYSARVTVTDPSNRSDTITVRINVIDVNEPPEITLTSDTADVEFAENGAGAVLRVRATDPERTKDIELTLSGSDASSFTLENGVLAFASGSLPDFEGGQTVYTVTVVATEADDDTETVELDARRDITITITDLNEAPAPTGQTAITICEEQSQLRSENASPCAPAWSEGTPLATYEDNDPEDFTVAWSLSGRDADDFVINADGQLQFREPPDFEARRGSQGTHRNIYDLTVQAFDGRNTGRLDVTVTVTNADDALVLLSRRAFATGTEITATLLRSDVASPRVRWEWEGATSAREAPVTTGGLQAPALTLADQDIGSPVNAEATWTDSSGQEKVVDSNLPGRSLPVVQPQPADGNTAPYFAADQVALSVDENTVPRTDIGERVGASDDDRLSSHGFSAPHQNWLTYYLGGTDAALFDIDRATGQISTKAPLDYEEETSHTVTVIVEDPVGASAETTVTITVNPVDEPPVLTVNRQPLLTDRVVVFHDSGDTGPVDITLAATDPEGADVTWSHAGTNAALFTLVDGVLQFVTPPAHNPAADNRYEVTVTAADAQTGGQQVMLTVIVAVPSGAPTQGPRGGPGGLGGPIFIPGGPPGGGDGGPSGPTPSAVDFEWNVERDIEALDPAQEQATDAWSDGQTIWVADNASGSGDAVYAYDLVTGKRVADREFELDPANLAPRGLWADGATAWVADSGRDRLFAYDLETGKRLPERDVVLARGNRAPRGLFGGGGLAWVLNANPSLFVYDLESGEVVAVYDLAAANSDPRGIWSDGVSVWVSDHGAKRIFAYRLPAPEPADPAEAPEPIALQRVPAEDFTELTRAGNLSPRGIWSDGEVMYVADANDGRVYSYNMPVAIDARLASLALSGIEIGEFSPDRTEYDGVPAEGVTLTTVEATANRRLATVVIAPPDADGVADNGHQVVLADRDEITVTVTSPDGSRTRVYRVRLSDGTATAPPTGLSLEVRAGGDLLVVPAGAATTAAALFGDTAVTIVWKYSPGTRAWDRFYLPARNRGGFAIAGGDVLWVVAPADQTLAVTGTPPPSAPPPGPITLTLRAGGDLLVVPTGAATTAAALFGDTAVTIVWKYSPSAGAWDRFYSPRLGRGGFAIAGGDVLWVVAPADQTLAVTGTPPPSAPPPGPITLTLRAGGNLLVVPTGAATTAAALFGDTAVTIVWKYSPSAGAWDRFYSPRLGRGGFAIAAGDVLWVVAPRAQTVGG